MGQRTVCSKCGRRLKAHCPKQSPQEECHHCLDGCKQRKGKPYCLICQRMLNSGVHPGPPGKTSRAMIEKDARQCRAQLESVRVGPFMFEDAPGRVLIKFAPIRKGEEAACLEPMAICQLATWMNRAKARKAGGLA